MCVRVRVVACCFVVVLASWDELEIPILQSVLGHADFVALSRVFYVIKSGDELGGGSDLVLGQGHISLQSLATFFANQHSAATATSATTEAATQHTQPTQHSCASSSSGSGASKSTPSLSPSPFPLTLSEGQDGSIGVGVRVRVPSVPGMLKAPQPGLQRNSWTFCSLVERHSASSGVLSGGIFVSIENRPEQLLAE